MDNERHANCETACADMDQLLPQLADPGLLHACLRDLFEHGPGGTREGAEGPRPSRSDITHFLAKWSRYAGLSQEACLEWLTPYAVGTLGRISTSSPGAIRHNTKGIVKFVYRQSYPFNCGKEQNAARCRCDPQCRLYHQPETPRPKPSESPVQPLQAVLPVKERYRERFEQALSVIREMRGSGKKQREMVERLNAEGLPTRTGRKWTDSILSNTLRKLD
jgi:hypothetical protein